jgi:hypothetical protein
MHLKIPRHTESLGAARLKAVLLFRPLEEEGKHKFVKEQLCFPAVPVRDSPIVLCYCAEFLSGKRAAKRNGMKKKKEPAVAIIII